MEELLYKPSVISHMLQGLLILYIFILLFIDETNTNKLTILLLLSITIGIHSLSHLGMEIVYKLNPIDYIRKNK